MVFVFRRNMIQLVVLSLLLGDSQIGCQPTEVARQEPWDAIPVTTTEEVPDRCLLTQIVTRPFGNVTSWNYPKPYPVNCRSSILIKVKPGYKLMIFIHDLDINTEYGDAFTIEPSSGTNIEVRDYTNKFNTDENAVLDKPSDTVNISLIVDSHTKTKRRGFCLSFEKIEMDKTANISDATLLPGWIQLYLAGVSAFEFTLIEDQFKEALAKITEIYVKEKELSADDMQIIQNNIAIHSMIACPASWPWSSNCIQVNLSIKLTDNPNELNAKHLAEIWRLHKQSVELYELGISNYELPDVEWFIWFWICLIFMISVVFALLLVIVARTKLIHYYFLKIQNMDANAERRVTNASVSAEQIPYFFTAENSQRMQFIKELEKRVPPRQPISKKQGPYKVCYVNRAMDVRNEVPEYDSNSEDDDQHIYHTIHYKS